jgi:hypothetical protein
MSIDSTSMILKSRRCSPYTSRFFTENLKSRYHGKVVHHHNDDAYHDGYVSDVAMDREGDGGLDGALSWQRHDDCYV